MKRPILVILGLAFVTCVALGIVIWRNQAPVDALSEPWIVVSVTSGNTLTVGRQGQEQLITLCGIDAPEPSQVYGDEAKRYLQQLLYDADDRIQVVEVGRSSDESLLAEVYTVNGQERLMQEELLLKGFVAIAPNGVEQCPNAHSMKAAEKIAQEQKVGMWDQ